MCESYGADASERVAGEMWKVLAEMKFDGAGSMRADHLATALKDLSERRNLREEEFRERLPKILWMLLVVERGRRWGLPVCWGMTINGCTIVRCWR
jgi:hypothetical protein